VERVRDAIYLRDDYRCLVAGSAWAAKFPCAGGLTIQHAIGKGMGGSAQFDRPELLRTFCWVHNTLAEADADFAMAARLFGWSLPRIRIDIDPEYVPVRYPDGRDYRLTNDFQRELMVPADVVEWRNTFYGQVVR
jgi:hypothetical protein